MIVSLPISNGIAWYTLVNFCYKTYYSHCRSVNCATYLTRWVLKLLFDTKRTAIFYETISASMLRTVETAIDTVSISLYVISTCIQKSYRKVSNPYIPKHIFQYNFYLISHHFRSFLNQSSIKSHISTLRRSDGQFMKVDQSFKSI